MRTQASLFLAAIFLTLTAHAENSQEAVLKCLFLNDNYQMIAAREIPLKLDGTKKFVLDFNTPVLKAGRYELALAVEKDFEITGSTLRDKKKNIAVANYNLHVKKGEVMDAFLEQREKELSSLAVSCVIR